MLDENAAILEWEDGWKHQALAACGLLRILRTMITRALSGTSWQYNDPKGTYLRSVNKDHEIAYGLRGSFIQRKRRAYVHGHNEDSVSTHVYAYLGRLYTYRTFR
jgi:hypothetical protein